MQTNTILCCALLASWVAVGAHAQVWPSKPIRLIIGIAAGGSSDRILRHASQDMMARIGQPLIVDHRPGANSIIAMDACAKAPPDGHTLCMFAPSGVVWNPYICKKLPYDPNRDFRPIGRMYFQIQSVFGRADLPANTIRELQALATSQPGSLNMGTLGINSQPDIFRQWLSDRWKATIVGIPYGGGAALTTALLAGQIDFVQMGLGSLSSSVNLVQSGRGKALAFSSAQRHKRFPAVPTMIESGLDEGAAGGVFWGIGGPVGLAHEIVSRFNAEILRLYKDPQFLELHENFFLEPAPTTPAEFDAYLKAQREFAAAYAKKFDIPKQ